MNTQPLPYQALFDASPLPGSLSRKRDGWVLAVNSAWVALTGFTREQVVGRTTREFNFWADPAERDRFLAELPCPVSHRSVRLKGGQIHRVRLHTSEIDIEGEPCLLVYLSEMMREHEAEVALESANRALQRRVELLEASEKLAHMGHWTNVDETQTADWSAGLYAITGLEPQHSRSREDGRSGIHPDDLAAWKLAREATDNSEVAFRWLHPDGRVRWFKTRMGRTQVANTASPVFGVIQDITSEREALHRLQEQLAFVQNITAHVPAVVFQGHVGSDWQFHVSFVNGAVRELLEEDPADVLRDGSRLFARISAKDLHGFQASLRAAVKAMTTVQQQVRIELPAKGLRWCSLKAVPSSDAEGGVLWHGFINDVTEVVQASQVLADTLEIMNQGMSKVDANGRVVLYSRQCLEMLNIPESLVVGKPHLRDMVRFQKERGDFGEDFCLAEEQTKVFLAAMVDKTRSDASIPIVERYQRKTPEGRTLDIRTRVLADGSVVRTYDDVTLFMEVQEALMAKHRDLEQTTALLEERTAALQDTLDSISQGFTKADASGRLVLYNRRMVELLDLPLALLNSKPTGEMVYRFQMERGDFGPNLAYVDDPFKTGFSTQKLSDIPDAYLRRTKDGRTLEFSARNLSDGGMVRTCTDVTSYIEVQEALRSERQRLEWVLEATQPGVWETDLVGNQMTVDARWAEMLGYTLAELAPVSRSTWTGLLHPDDLGPALEANRAHRENETPYFDCDFRMRHKDGHWVWINGRGRVHQRDGEGRGLFMSGTHLDISLRVAAEEQVRALNASLELRVEQRTADLERTLRDMEAISYSIAHDLRAPLRAVNGFAAVIAESEASELNPASRDLFERIVKSSRNMGQMLTDMLALLQVVRVDLAPVPVSMNDVVSSVIDTLVSDGAKVLIDTQDLPSVQGDSVLLRQMVLNLLDNAIKYSDEQAQPKIWIGHDAGQKAFYVRDNGVGFDMAHAGKLFGLFQRLHAGSKVPGMGVGLAIVFRIIERHGGRIWAESQPGKGSTFWWTLAEKK